jgi:hypothetical protein
MADYKDVPVDPTWNAEQIYKKIADLLVGHKYSVEVIPSGQSVILRAWYDEHCDIKQHNDLG